jgi:Pput_2613-like deaminase
VFDGALLSGAVGGVSGAGGELLQAGAGAAWGKAAAGAKNLDQWGGKTFQQFGRAIDDGLDLFGGSQLRPAFATVGNGLDGSLAKPLSQQINDGFQHFFAANTGTQFGLPSFGWIQGGSSLFPTPSQANLGKFGVEVGPAYPFGKGLHEANHTADVIIKREGKIIAFWREISGEQTDAQKALKGWEGAKSSHTETKGLTRINLQEGDQMRFIGVFKPCSSCRGAMTLAQKQSGATITYEWKQDGATWVWEAGKGLIQKGSVKALPGKTLKWK